MAGAPGDPRRDLGVAPPGQHSEGASPRARARWPLLWVRVSELSMVPALRHGDWLLAWRTRRIRPGQVVLAWHPRRSGFLVVKRAARRVEGGWWLESDFPGAPGATDSSGFGPVPDEMIVGRSVWRYRRNPKSPFMPLTTPSFPFPRTPSRKRPPACA